MRMSEWEGSIVRFSLALMVMMLLACGLSAQSTTDGAIGGTVSDQSGAVVPDARHYRKEPWNWQYIYRHLRRRRSLPDHASPTGDVFDRDYCQRVRGLQSHQRYC